MEGILLKRKETKELMKDKNEIQKIEIFEKHYLVNKSKGLFATDNSYEIYAKDLNTNEETCIMTDATKADIKKY